MPRHTIQALFQSQASVSTGQAVGRVGADAGMTGGVVVVGVVLAVVVATHTTP